MVDDALRKTGNERRVMLALPTFQGVGEAVARGRLIASVPIEFAQMVAKDLGLEIYRLPIDVPAPEISIYWHKRHDRNPAHLWLREQIYATTEAFRAELK